MLKQVGKINSNFKLKAQELRHQQFLLRLNRSTKGICCQKIYKTMKIPIRDLDIIKSVCQPRQGFYQEERRCHFVDACGVQPMRHMLYTAGSTLGDLSLPYAQQAVYPIQMRQLQRAANSPLCTIS